MKLSKGFYISPKSSDLKVEVIKVGYQDDKYVKAKLNFWHRKHNYLIDCNVNYKLDKEKIKHWIKINAI